MQTILWPGITLFGDGALAQLPAQIEALGVTHLFALIDGGVPNLADAVMQAAGDATLTVYDTIVPNPDAAAVDAAGAAFKASGADAILAAGGGSALDTAKGVRLLAASPDGVSVAAYLSTLGDQRRPNPRLSDMPPMIAIPTTSGTGSEVTPWGVVTDHTTQQKAGVGTNLIPEVAILDPQLTLTLPSHLTAATGMDALSHLIEAYVSTNAQPMLDPLILRGIDLIGRYLRVAVAEPSNLEARSALLEASMLGGVALSSNWLGACHSLAHQLSTFADMHHGLACAIMLPPQMAWSVPHAEARYAEVAFALADENASAQDAPKLVDQLNRDIGLPTRLSACGVTAEQLPTLAAFSFKDLNWWTNPIQPTSSAEMLTLYEAVF